MQKISIIDNLKELEKYEGVQVCIIGEYGEINGAKRPGQFSPSGRAYIRLSCGSIVAIDTQDAGIRPDEEMEKFKGKKAIVFGTFARWQTLWGDGTIASIVSDSMLNAKVSEAP